MWRHNGSPTPVGGIVFSIVHCHLPWPLPWASVCAPYNSATDRSYATLYAAWLMEKDHR